MSFVPAPQPEPGGGLSVESASQVVVRAGKAWVCSACGVMVQLPDDVVGQMVIVPEESGRQTPVGETPAAQGDSAQRPSDLGVPHAGEADERGDDLVEDASCRPQGRGGPFEEASRRTEAPPIRPPRPRRPTRPGQTTLGHERIDGLVVPTTQEMERLLAWVDYRLKRLDGLQRLERELVRQKVEQAPSSHAEVQQAVSIMTGSAANQTPSGHAHEDVSMAPDSNASQERGPP